ncbi:MAG TPA: M67 family metallopeptidase [Pyrinomonadaceae bacterium]|jgi:proteasome lid subunit RPN8/RPN11
MIAIPDRCVDEIRRHGASDYPYECCGLLLGDFDPSGAKSVVETYPISNGREESAKRNRFLITPDELMRGERYAREKRLEVVGFYHSHPDSPAVASQYDLEHAWPSYSYIIVATARDHTGDLRSWVQRPDRSQFDEEPIELVVRT